MNLAAAMPLGFQVIFRTPQGRVLAPNVASRRKIARAIQRVGRKRGLIGFGVADTHGHAGLIATTQQVGAFIHDLRLVLRHTLHLEIGPPTVKPVHDVWHAMQLIGYMHRQGEHHGVDRDVFLEATSLPDLVGLRVCAPWLADRVATELPRFEGCTLPVRWSSAPFGHGIALAHLADAAAAVFALPDLQSRTSEAVLVRRAAVHAAAEFTSFQVANALGIAERTVREIRSQAVDPTLIQTVRRAVSVRVAAAELAVPLAVSTLFVREQSILYVA